MRDAPHATSHDTCNRCGHGPLAQDQYDCPACGKVLMNNLSRSMTGVVLQFLAFGLVVFGPLAALTFYLVTVRAIDSLP